MHGEVLQAGNTSENRKQTKNSKKKPKKKQKKSRLSFKKLPRPPGRDAYPKRDCWRAGTRPRAPIAVDLALPRRWSRQRQPARRRRQRGCVGTAAGHVGSGPANEGICLETGCLPLAKPLSPASCAAGRRGGARRRASDGDFLEGPGRFAVPPPTNPRLLNGGDGTGQHAGLGGLGAAGGCRVGLGSRGGRALLHVTLSPSPG